MLNRTHAEHALIAVLIQLILAIPLVLMTYWLAPGLLELLVPIFLFGTGAVACAIFLGREISQHEFKGGGPKVVSPLYGLLHHWTADSIIDFAAPVAACLAVVGLYCGIAAAL